MSGNTLGRLFTVTTFGESHGPAMGCIVDGCPPGLPLSEEDIQPDLDRRKPGKDRFTSQRREPDRIQILSGCFEGKTTGAPIGLLINNEDARTSDYDDLKEIYRPGHADYTYQKKYGYCDYRGGGRASARETVMRVTAGAIAKKYLSLTTGTTIQGYLAQVGEITPKKIDFDTIEKNSFFWPDPSTQSSIETLIDALRREGDSIGAAVKVIARAVPVGLGEPVFDKLDADIASAMMGIPAVKAVAIGDGFDCILQRGSEHRDEMTPTGFLSNHAGGILGGISTGQEIIVTLALKPASSIRIPGRSVNHSNESVSVVTTGRHDPCVGIRAVPVAEAMLAIVLMDHLLRHRAQNHPG